MEKKNIYAQFKDGKWKYLGKGTVQENYSHREAECKDCEYHESPNGEVKVKTIECDNCKRFK